MTNVDIPDTAMHVGDRVTVTLTVEDDGGDTYTNVSGTVGGFTLDPASLTRVNSTTYTASFTVTDGGTDVAAGDDIPVNITLEDSSRNTSTPYTTPVSQANDPIDANGPEITGVSMDNTAMHVGDTVTVTLTVEDDGGNAYTGISGTVGGFTLDAASLTQIDSTTYTALFKVSDGGTDVAAADDIPTDITITDAAGSPGAAYTTAISQDADAIDANNPGLTSLTPENGATEVAVDTDLTLTFDEAVYKGQGNFTIKDTATGNTVAVIPVASANIGGWGTDTLTINPANDLDPDTAYHVLFPSGAVLDEAGNAAAAMDDTASWGFSTPDTTAPELVSFSSSTDDGAYKAGDAINITATVSETVKQGSTLTVTLNTGASIKLTADQDGTTLTGMYTVGDNENTADLDVSGISNVALADLAGNTTSSSSLPSSGNNLADGNDIVVDTTAPSPAVPVATDDAGKVQGTLSSGDRTDDTALELSGTCGEGSTVSVYNGTDLLGEAVVTGTRWTYTAQVQDGMTYGFAVKETDIAGNESGFSTALGITGDTTAPANTVSGIHISTDAGNSHTDFITNQASQTITATLADALASDETLYASVDGGAAWEAVSASGTTVSWATTLAGGENEIQFKVVDGAGNEGTVASQVYTLDTAAPSPAAPVATDDQGKVQGTLSSGDRTDDTALELSGTCEEGSTVSVYNGTDLLGEAVVTGTRWIYTAQVQDGTSYGFAVKETDIAGNESGFSTALSIIGDSGDSGGPPADTTPPVVTNVDIPDTAMHVGDRVTVTLTVEDDGGDTYTNVSGTVGGFTLDPASLTRVNSTTYTASFTVTDGGTDVAAGDDIPVNITLEDSSRNTSTPYTTPVSQANDPIDANGPEITGVSMDNTAMHVGDTVTVTLTVEDDGGNAYTGISGTVGGFTLDAASLTQIDSTTYTALFKVSDGGTDVAAADDIPTDITITDAAGSPGAAYTTAISQDADAIDANNPLA